MKMIQRVMVVLIAVGVAFGVQAVGAGSAMADPIGVAGEGELPVPAPASVDAQVEGQVSVGPTRTYLIDKVWANDKARYFYVARISDTEGSGRLVDADLKTRLEVQPES